MRPFTGKLQRIRTAARALHEAPLHRKPHPLRRGMTLNARQKEVGQQRVFGEYVQCFLAVRRGRRPRRPGGMHLDNNKFSANTHRLSSAVVGAIINRPAGGSTITTSLRRKRTAATIPTSRFASHLPLHKGGSGAYVYRESSAKTDCGTAARGLAALHPQPNIVGRSDP